MATDKQNRWLQNVNHYLAENVSFDTLIEMMQDDLNKYSKTPTAKPNLMRERQNYIYQMQRFQSYTLQAVNAANDVIAELLLKNEELKTQVQNQNSLINLLNTKENEKNS